MQKQKPKLRLVYSSKTKAPTRNPHSNDCNRCGGVIYGANRDFVHGG